MKITAKAFLIMSLLLILSAGLTALADETTQKELPIGLTAEEMTRLDEIGINHRVTPPPSGDIRNPGEWEPSEGVIIRYPLGISYSLVAEMSQDLIVYCLVSSGYQSTAYNNFSNNGVNMSNVEFIITNTDSYWTRDYGPWFIFDGNGDFGIVDPIYNRPRPNDDAAPGAIGSAWGVPVYGMAIETPGGNHMSNGLGTSISTDLVYAENPGLSQAQIDSIMMAYLGNDYVVVDDALGEYIEHIDCWAKFLAPQKILVLELPSSNPQSDDLDDAADYFASLIGPYGRPYDVYRVYSPGGDQAYTNSVILNNKVFVPVSGSAYYDNLAIAAYEEAMPGYDILGFTGSWYNTDALHCRTMGVPDRGTLFINHIPPYVVSSNVDDYEISAIVHDHSETGLVTGSPKIYYGFDDGKFYPVTMSSTAVADSFVGYIPAQDYGTDIVYYLQAEDNSGRREKIPYMGMYDPHPLHVNMPPEITSPEGDTCKAGGTFAFRPEFGDVDDSVHTYSYSAYPAWASVDGDSLTGTPPDSTASYGFTAEVSDPYVTSSASFTLFTWRCGDVNLDNSVNVIDIIYLIDNKYQEGPAPQIAESADVDNSGNFDILDIIYLIEHKYKDGPAPICP